MVLDFAALHQTWAGPGGVRLGFRRAKNRPTFFVVDKFWLSRHVAQEKPVAAAAPIATASTPAIPGTPVIPEKSVAVLPFVDMSEKKDQEYFSDGLKRGYRGVSAHGQEAQTDVEFESLDKRTAFTVNRGKVDASTES
jgi:hypothetical protein